MIEVKELVKKYRSGDEEITATNNVTFTFQDKGFYIVLGKIGKKVYYGTSRKVN